MTSKVLEEASMLRDKVQEYMEKHAPDWHEKDEEHAIAEMRLTFASLKRALLNRPTDDEEAKELVSQIESWLTRTKPN